MKEEPVEEETPKQARKRPKKYLVVTPQPTPLKREVPDENESLTRALLARVKGRPKPELTCYSDRDFLQGIASVYGLVYAGQILRMVENCGSSGSVRVEIVEEE